MNRETDPAKAALTGLLSMPEFIPGVLSSTETRAVFDSGTEWRVVYDTRTRLTTVHDAGGQIIGWTQPEGKGIRQVVLPGGVKPPVFFQDRFFSRRVWIGDQAFKPVMMLEGRKRVFGDDRINLEHRDYKNEVRFRCAPEFLVAGVIVALEVFAGSQLRSQGKG